MRRPHPRCSCSPRTLARELGCRPAGVGDTRPGSTCCSASAEGEETVAQGYAGHQFGGFSPRLGDGRALLLGEVRDVSGRLRDVHLKGSGRTPFSRGGDGKAGVAQMLREHVVGEAMHAIGIPTTRALAVIATGDGVRRGDDAARGGARPGGREPPAGRHVRVRQRHLRDRDLLERLDGVRDRPAPPGAAQADRPALALFEAVLDAQAALVAQWMLVGFVHGVMNTDNVTISGETIDYGPCAFMDAYDPATVFSSIDHGGRYAYGNQPSVAQWNLARFAETLLPLIGGDDPEAAVARDRGAGRRSRSVTAAHGRRDAGQARPRDGARSRRDAGRRPARAAARAGRRPRPPLPGAGGGGARRRSAGRATCSSTARRSTRGLARWRRAGGARRATSWTASTRSTCRATTSSRTR